MVPSECACGLVGNHRLLDSLVIAIYKVEVSTRVCVVHEVELGEDTVGIVGVVGDRISVRAGGSREVTIVVLLAWNFRVMVTAHITRSVEEGVVVEETGLIC